MSTEEYNNPVYSIPHNVSRVLLKYLQAQNSYTLSRIKDRCIAELNSSDTNIVQNAKDVLDCIAVIEVEK